MTTTTNFRNPPMEDSSVLHPALDNWRMADDGQASPGAGSWTAHSPNNSATSGAASSAWTGAWAFRGIPELDSPFAG